MTSNAGLGYNLKIGQKKAIENANNNPFNQMPFLDNGTGVELIKTARKLFAPKADDPTVAGADPSMNLPDAMKSVDPQGIAAILKQMLPMLAMAAATSSATSPSAINDTVTDAFTGALSILANTFGFDNTIFILANTFTNNQFASLETTYDDIVVNAIVSLIQNYAQFGVNNLPYLVSPAIEVSNNGPIPSPIVSPVPDLYLRVYYISSSNPFPGYVTWEGPAGDFVYTVMDNSTLPYSSASIQTTTDVQSEIVSILSPYFAAGSLSVNQLNAALDQAFSSTQSNGMNNAIGNNSSNNLMQLLSQILGILGGIISNTQNNHIPKSVLNQQSVNDSLKKFANNMSIIKKMKDQTKGAFNIESILGQLSQLGSQLSSLISMNNNGGLSPSSIISLLNSGLSQSSVSSLNNVVVGNSTLTANNVGSIASLTSSLEAANASATEIASVQILLGEVLNVSNA